MASIPGICLRCQGRILSQRRLPPFRTLSRTPRFISTSARRAQSKSQSSQVWSPSPPVEAALRYSQSTTQLGRHFSSSPRRRLQVLLNPRKDEEGNDMVVDITPRAANRLKEIMTSDSNPDLALRISVESGGCHGFQYLMSLINMSKVSQEEDTVFEGRDGAKIVLDEPSLELLKGSKVDYTMELIGSQFKITDNPKATSSCGCGTSFDIAA